MWGFVSADGKVWKPLSTERPLLIGGGTLGLPVPYLGTPEPEVCVYNSTDHAYHPTPKGNYDCWTNPSSVSDVLQMFFDDSLGEWVVHHKMWVEGPDGMEAWRIHGAGRGQRMDWGAPCRRRGPPGVAARRGARPASSRGDVV